MEWPSAAPCPPPADIDAEVARLLGERHKELPVTRFQVELHQPAANAYELSLQFAGAEADQARSLRLNSCAEVHEAAILLAAMALQPGALEPDARNPSAPPPPPPPPPPAEEPVPARPLALRIDLSGLLDLWSLPAVSGGPALGASLVYGSWLVGISGRYLVPRQATGDLPPGTSARIDLLASALVLSFRSEHARLRWGPVAEMELGYLRGRAKGTLDGGDAGALWACVWGGLSIASKLGQAGSPLRRLELSLSGLLGLPLTRPRFALQGESAFYTTSPASLRFFLGVSFALGATE